MKRSTLQARMEKLEFAAPGPRRQPKADNDARGASPQSLSGSTSISAAVTRKRWPGRQAGSRLSARTQSPSRPSWTRPSGRACGAKRDTCRGFPLAYLNADAQQGCWPIVLQRPLSAQRRRRWRASRPPSKPPAFTWECGPGKETLRVWGMTRRIPALCFVLEVAAGPAGSEATTPATNRANSATSR